MTAPGAESTPLDMARNCIAAVRAVADWQERDPLEARVHQAGRMGKESAELAACMALVSIAENLERIAGLLEREGGAADV